VPAAGGVLVDVRLASTVTLAAGGGVLMHGRKSITRSPLLRPTAFFAARARNSLTASAFCGRPRIGVYQRAA